MKYIVHASAALDEKYHEQADRVNALIGIAVTVEADNQKDAAQKAKPILNAPVINGYTLPPVQFKIEEVYLDVDSVKNTDHYKRASRIIQTVHKQAKRDDWSFIDTIIHEQLLFNGLTIAQNGMPVYNCHKDLVHLYVEFRESGIYINLHRDGADAEVLREHEYAYSEEEQATEEMTRHVAMLLNVESHDS